MKSFFNHILVPVLFNSDTPHVIGKAIDAANEFNCDLHLLHVQTGAPYMYFLRKGPGDSPFFQDNMEELETRMESLVDENRHALSDGLLLSGTVMKGSWQLAMKEIIFTTDIDLVIIPNYSGKLAEASMRQIDISNLSLQTQCPVLTVTHDFDVSRLQNIVVPVNDYLPLKKLTAATFLARKFKGMVHLVGHGNSAPTKDKLDTTWLTKAYQLLTEYTDVKIHCGQEGGTMEDEALEYARRVEADLIVVNPGKESQPRGWINRWLGKYIYHESGIPILTISPQQ